MAKAGTGQARARKTRERKYTLHIFKDVNGNFKVRPGVQVVERGEELEWTTKGTAATVMFPQINGKDVVNPNPIYIKKNGTKTATVENFPKVLTTQFNDVEIPYSVFCQENLSYAEGNSDPKIIVKGP